MEECEIDPRSPGLLTPRVVDFYRRVLRALREAEVETLVGGAFALRHLAGIARNTKDLDVLVRPRDADRALAALASVGCQVEITYPHWLAKGRCAELLVDVVYRAGNGFGEVDDEWFAHAEEGEVLGEPVRLAPPEEQIWHKAFVMERERYDGADVAHILRLNLERLDWERLLRRFGPHWRILLSHLILFGFIYPTERQRIPAAVMRELLGRLAPELESPSDSDNRWCYGTLISREQYLTDIEQWGYHDSRLPPAGRLTPADITRLTEAIRQDQ